MLRYTSFSISSLVIMRLLPMMKFAVVSNIIHICNEILPFPHTNTNVYKEIIDFMCRLIIRCIENIKETLQIIKR